MDVDRDQLIQAVLVSPALWPEGLEILQWWFDLQPPATAFGLSVDARAQRLTFWGTGERDSHMRVVSDFLDGGSSGALARGRWEHSIAALESPRVGTWLELSQRRASGGWFIPGPMCARSAVATLEPAMGRSRVMSWLHEHAISEVLRWACSSFGSRLSTEFVARVGGASSAQALCPFEAMRAWTEQTEAPSGFDTFRDATTGVHLVVGSEGPIQVGRYVSHPTVDHAVALAKLFSGFAVTAMVDLQGRLDREPSALVLGTSYAEYYFDVG